MWMEMQQVDKEQVWDAERGFYGQHVDASHPPQRVLTSGAANSFSALLRRNKHFILDKCAPPNAGFKVQLLKNLKLHMRCQYPDSVFSNIILNRPLNAEKKNAILYAVLFLSNRIFKLHTHFNLIFS
jgi:hypothetical protein